MDATEVFLNFPENLITAIVFNGGVIAIVYFLVWKIFKNRLANWRIQLRGRVNAEQIKREIKNALYTLSVGALFTSIVIYLSTYGFTKIYTDYSENLFFSFFGFFILLIIDDTWFYWIHRLLHHPKIYRYVHAEHHKSVHVNPFTSLSFHFLEPVLLSLWIFPVTILLPTYAPVLGLMQLYGFLDNVKSHLGYEFYPSWWNKSGFRMMTSSTHHNMHHSKFKGNYGVHFRFWDKVMKTEFDNYEQEYDKIQYRKRARHL